MSRPVCDPTGRTPAEACLLRLRALSCAVESERFERLPLERFGVGISGMCRLVGALVGLRLELVSTSR